MILNRSKLKLLIAIIIVLSGAGFAFIHLKNNLPASIKEVSDKILNESNNLFKSGTVSNTETYNSNKFKFSFGYPKGFSVSSFADGGGETVLIKNAAKNNGFQIHIAPFDEPDTQNSGLTKERILKDIPDMVINNAADITLEGKKALSFTSQDELAKETLNVWLVHGKYLYQITAYKNFEKDFKEILLSWQFLY